jgi:hypothetical protein
VQLYEDRIIAGVIKAGIGQSLEEVGQLLSRDIEIVVPPARTTHADLWPCIWALCACLERQFTGNIYVQCGLSAPLGQPAKLSERCVFGTLPKTVPLRIYLGIPAAERDAIWGDARAHLIAHSTLLEGNVPAHPAAGFALAGYLGYAALAQTIGIPTHRLGYCTDRLVLPIGDVNSALFPLELTVIGLGQLGQAYLALLYFLAIRTGSRPSLALVDKDFFEMPNQRTQILLAEGGAWEGCQKAKFLAELVRSWGWTAQGDLTTLDWGWKCPSEHPRAALLGLDDLDVRRMAVAAGYDWIIDAGLGTSFAEPRVSWHSLPPDNLLARTVFKPVKRDDSLAFLENTLIQDRLLRTPGQCGWVTFKNVTAAAPAMGLAGAAYAFAELLRGREAVSGRACLWSTLLPFSREPLRFEQASFRSSAMNGIHFLNDVTNRDVDSTAS